MKGIKELAFAVSDDIGNLSQQPLLHCAAFPFCCIEQLFLNTAKQFTTETPGFFSRGVVVVVCTW
jgi:hypothetical protein